MITGLTFLGLGRKRSAADDLDTALAGAQVGLERKRRQWLMWLAEERRAPLVQRVEQSRLAPGAAPGGPAAVAPGDAQEAADAP
jgi:hypothetical protein